MSCTSSVAYCWNVLKPGDAAILDLIREVRTHRQPAAVAHAIEPASAVGERFIVGAHNLPADIEAEARSALAAAANRLVRLDERELFIENPHSPPCVYWFSEPATTRFL